MRQHRFLWPFPVEPGQQACLTGGVAQHVKVLRVRPGDPLILFDGQGGEWQAEAEAVGREVLVRILARRINTAESPLEVHLVQAISSADRMDYTVQKATELGICTIQPVMSSRSIVKLDGDRAAKRQQHWQQVADAAAEQSGRAVSPRVRDPVALPRWLAEGAPQAGRGVLLDPGAVQRLGDLPRPDGRVTLLIGPEGGWSEAELQAAAAAGIGGVRLGPRVLRTETAAVAALAAMQALWGDF